MPVILAVASSYLDKAIPADLVAIGEVGLTGEIRSVSNLNQRLSEAARLGFTKCIIPMSKTEGLDVPKGMAVYRAKDIRQAIEIAI